MKAEEMFRCLGYEKTSKKDSENIIYEKVETYFSDLDDKDTIKKSTYIHYISFDLNYNTVNSSVQNRDSFDGELAAQINAMEMLAVIKQCKEIGWLDD